MKAPPRITCAPAPATIAAEAHLSCSVGISNNKQRAKVATGFAKPDGVYPRYTFIKYQKDTDGKLLLEHFSAQVRSEDKLIPVEIKFDFMLILPEGSVTIDKDLLDVFITKQIYQASNPTKSEASS